MKFIHDRVKISSIKRLIISQWPLILILFLAGFLRLYKIFDIPPSLNWDEISHGYNSFSILRTGKDEWGVKFPLIFRAYGDYKLPLYIYLTAISEAFLGLNFLSVRLVSILSGVGLVWISFLISKKVVKDNILSLLAAFLTAVSPWSLFVSRVAVEANLGAFLFALGILFLINWSERKKTADLIWGVISWGLALYSYNSARVLVPIFFLLTLIFAVKKKKVRQFVISAAIFVIFLLPVLSQFLDKSGRARFNLVSLVDQGTISRIIEKRAESKLPFSVARLAFNRPTFFTASAIKNYFSNLSPGYLFFEGGENYQFSLPAHGLLYLVTAPFLLFGLTRVLIKGNFQEKILGFWFLVSFVPSAITKDAPHVLRSILVLPSPMILTAVGVKMVLNEIEGKYFFRGKFVVAILVLGIILGFFKWWSDYQNVYRKNYSWAWQYGYQEAALFVKQNYKNYEKIYFTKRYGEPHEFVLFFLGWDPKAYQDDKEKIWDYHARWYWVDSFDKFEFINDWEIVDRFKIQSASRRTKYKILLVTSPGNYPEGWNVIKTVYFLDGKPVFDILERI